MFRHFAIVSLALVALAPAASARPGGSYQQTCDSIRQRGPYLTAECETRDGDSRVSSLDLRGCQGDVENRNGRLYCQRGWGGNGDGYDRRSSYDRPEGAYRRPRYNPYADGYSTYGNEQGAY